MSETDQRFHPYNIILTLVLLGLCAMFLSLTIGFVYTRVENGVAPVRIPFIFVVNTIVLLLSSYTMFRARNAYKSDNTKTYQLSILFTVLLSFIFLAGQIIGWKSLFDSQMFLTTSNAASYLYLISGLHFVHVVAGLPFLILFLITAYRKMKEPHTVLVYFTNPEKRIKLKLLSLYWNFLDVLWIYLVLFLLVNYWIQ